MNRIYSRDRGFRKNVEMAYLQIKDDKTRKEQEKNNTARNDEKTRREIIKMMWKNFKSGKAIDEAVEIAMQSKLSKSFDYLTKNGLDKKQCFKNWLQGYIKRIEKEEKFKLKGERS